MNLENLVREHIASNNPSFEVGDLVSLKSGQNVMTIYSKNTNKNTGEVIYKCVWFDVDLHIHYEDLIGDVLIKHIQPTTGE